MEYSIQNAEVLKAYKKTEKKDGTPYMTKTGKPFTMWDIYFNNDVVDDITFTGKCTFLDFDNRTPIEVGKTLSGILKKNGEYWNFELPKTSVRGLEDRVLKLEMAVKDIYSKISTDNVNVFEPKTETLKTDKSDLLKELDF